MNEAVQTRYEFCKGVAGVIIVNRRWPLHDNDNPLPPDIGEWTVWYNGCRVGGGESFKTVAEAEAWAKTYIERRLDVLTVELARQLSAALTARENLQVQGLSAFVVKQEVRHGR